MIVTIIRLALGVILLGINIALRLAIIFGTLIAWALAAVASHVTHFVQRRNSNPGKSSRSTYPDQQPDPPPVRGEFKPREIRRRPRK